MPSTNLPLTDALRDAAGWKWQPGGSTSVAEAVHALNWPAELIPGGGAQFNTNKFRQTVESLDKDQRETWTIGSGREEATLRVRFDGWPESLLDMMEDAADGVDVEYYPRLASTNLSFPVQLLDADARISEDEDRFSKAEYEADLRVRDASTDRQGFWWLKSPNKLKNPRLAIGTTDGLAEDWTRSAAATVNDVTIASTERAQRLRLPSTETGSVRVHQDVSGALPGDVWEVSIDIRAGFLSNASLRVQLQAFSATGFIEAWQSTTRVFNFTRLSVTSTGMPTNTDTVRAIGQVVDTSTGNGSTGGDRFGFFRDAKLTRTG